MLSPKNRTAIVTIFFVALLLFGPVEPFGLFARLAYLVILPTTAWFILTFIGRLFDIDEVSNDRISRALAASVAGALFVAACMSFTAESHSECSHLVRAVDGSRECVGDDVTVPGPDYGAGLMYIFLACAAFGLAISRRSDWE